MNRRTATLLGALVAIAAAALIIGLSGLLAAERQGDRERYAAAMARQRRAAGRAAPVTAAESRAPRAAFCVRGVDTFASTLRAALSLQLVDGQQRLDVAALRAVSSLAIRAERYVEQAVAGPALPQRMGRTRHVAEDGRTAWKPLEPPRVGCDDGDGFALFRLDMPAAAPAPAKVEEGKKGSAKVEKAKKKTARGKKR